MRWKSLCEVCLLIWYALENQRSLCLREYEMFVAKMWKVEIARKILGKPIQLISYAMNS